MNWHFLFDTYNSIKVTQYKPVLPQLNHHGMYEVTTWLPPICLRCDINYHLTLGLLLSSTV